MEKINKSQIVKIAVLDFTPHNLYSIRPRKTFFGFEIQKPGLYLFNCYLGEKIPEYCTIIDNEVMIKPRIDFHMSNDDIETKYFESLKAAQEYADLDLGVRNWINV